MLYRPEPGRPVVVSVPYKCMSVTFQTSCIHTVDVHIDQAKRHSISLHVWVHGEGKLARILAEHTRTM
jgi:hypothetical protein